MKSKIIFAAFVLAVLAISAPRAEAQEKFPTVKDAFTVPDYRPRGVFALVNHGKAPTEAIWKNPCILS